MISRFDDGIVPKIKPGWVAALIFTVGAGLAFQRLDNTYFWNDEAQVGFYARNLLSTGRPTGWDGRNLYAYRNGTVLDKNLETIEPRLQHVVTAASFRLFGVSTWAGRFPHVVVGLLGLALFAVTLRRDFRKQWIPLLYAMAVLGLSVVFLLNIRQCKYYALALLLGVAAYDAYRRCTVSPNWPNFLLLGAVSALLFHTNYLLCASFLLSLTLIHLVFYRRAFSPQDWGKVATAVALFLAATAPYALAHKIWLRPDQPIADLWYVRKATLVWWNLRELNLLGCMPWSVALGLLYLLLCHQWPLFKRFGSAQQARGRNREISETVAREKPEGDWSGYAEDLRPVCVWIVLCLAFVVFLSVFSPQSTKTTLIADVRFLIAILPFLAGLVGAFLWFVHLRSPLVAGALFVTLVTTNIATLIPFSSRNSQFRLLLPAYISEVLHDYPTSYRAAVDFLQANAKQDDLVLAFPEYCNYPLIFYTGDRFRFGGLLSHQTPLPKEAVARLPSYLFIENSFPDWVIAFSRQPELGPLLRYLARPHEEAGRSIQYQYRPVANLNVYWDDTSRPELPWHTFGPRKDFRLDSESVYVFKRVNLVK